MQIREAIVHRIDKERQGRATLTLRGDVLPKDGVLTSLVEKSRDAYNSNPNRAVGIFQPNQLVYPFSKLLDSYLTAAGDFIGFTHQSMTLLENHINGEPFATGGYAIFIDYEDDSGKRFFMIVILKLKGGVGINEINLALSENWNLDVDHLHEAARVNIENWKSSKGNYISFARTASTNRTFTQYFREFIGCTQFIESKAQTTILVKAITTYCQETGLNADATKILKAKAFEYFEEQKRENKPISLAAISMRFNNDEPKAFTDFLAKKEIEIGDGFEPDRGSYKYLKRIGGKDTEMSISFDRALLGNTVSYNKEKKVLTFLKLPDSLVEELDKEM
ncbi:nucleoid-associated protein [Massilia phyllosphaerae]|uniref:nucleoid-associated protein n=1 Tax=Massilia phyllosphaerae TaxID=3106034 RepID=UPI002B1CCB92|nr:nucleoid-associated protein [Massilia sp. SGZ-792]